MDLVAVIRACGVALLLGLGACAEQGCVRVTAPVQLLEQPFPIGFEPRRTNRVLGTVPPGDYRYSGTKTAHTHLMYRISIDTLTGYIAFSSETVNDCPQTTR